MRAHHSLPRLISAALLVSAGAAVYAQPLYPTQQILDPNPAPGNEFGKTVAIGDGILAISAPGDDTVATDAGAVHLFSRQGQTWIYDTTIYPIDGRPGDAFGTSMSLEGSRLIIGHPSCDIYGDNARRHLQASRRRMVRRTDPRLAHAQ